MPLPDPQPGLVISYAYLWFDQASAGQTEGRKDRPTVIVVNTRDEDGETVVYVAPITHTDPGDKLAVELTSPVKRKLGLDDARSWVITSEMNRFVWPGHDLRPISRRDPGRFDWGYLPVDVFARIKANILTQVRSGRGKSVRRE